MNKEKSIDVWGDGEQTRSFLYIDDCLQGTLDVFKSDEREVFNIGSEEQVSINQMIKIIEKIANYPVQKNYQLDKPKGVRGRSSDNSLVTKKIGWKPNFTLKQGLSKTYEWIEKKIKDGSDIENIVKEILNKKLDLL